MSERWWRAKNSAVNNRKLQKLPGDLFKAWFNINCLASENDGVVPSVEDVAFALRLSEQKVALILTQLVTAKMLDKVDGQMVPHDWDDHQFKTDKKDPTAKNRMQRYRDRKRNGETVVTESYERNERNVTVSEKRPEAEAKADTESEQSRADAGAPVDEEFGRKLSALTVSVGLAFSTRSMQAPALNRCAQWLRQGYAQGTILGAIERVLKRGKVVSTLDYFDAAIAEDHAKAPAASAGPQIVSIQEFIIEGTPEWSAWNQHLRETTGKGSPVTDNRDERGVLRRGWFRPTLVPPGYDEATGEKLPPSAEDAA